MTQKYIQNSPKLLFEVLSNDFIFLKEIGMDAYLSSIVICLNKVLIGNIIIVPIDFPLFIYVY